MEELLQNQKTEVDDLVRLIRNYNKDGAERRHERYLKDKITTFNESFRVIKEHDDMIQEQLQLQPQHKEQQYFIDKTFMNIKALYEAAIANIRSKLAALSGQPPTKNGSAIPQSTGESPQQLHTENDGSSNSNDVLKNLDTSKVGNSSLDDSNLLNILYNDLMDCMAAVKDLNEAASFGFIEASMNNLNIVWAEFRSAYLKERSAKRAIQFSYPCVLNKYMKVTGEIGNATRAIRKFFKLKQYQDHVVGLNLGNALHDMAIFVRKTGKTYELVHFDPNKQSVSRATDNFQNSLSKNTTRKGYHPEMGNPDGKCSYLAWMELLKFILLGKNPLQKQDLLMYDTFDKTYYTEEKLNKLKAERSKKKKEKRI